MNHHSSQRSDRSGLLVVSLIAARFLSTVCAVYVTPTDSAWPCKDALAKFAASLSADSKILYPDRNPDMFLSHAQSFNLLKSNSPGLIIYPATEKDLRTAVAFASKYRIRVVPRCSGVDFNGRSTGRGVILIKTKKLNTVTYDNVTKTVTFGSGASHADVYIAMAAVGRIYIGGSYKLVCPAGCLGGGCHSLFSRQHGLGIDNVVQIRLVLYNGTLITLNKSSHPDLFRAYLGAGHSSFGVAVSFTALTHDAPASLLKLDVALSLLDPRAASITPPTPAANVLTTFLLNSTWHASIPPTLAGTIKFAGPNVSLSLVYTGFNPSTAFDSLQSLLASPFVLGTPSTKTFNNIVEYALASFPPPNEVFVRRFAASAFIPPKQDALDKLTQFILAKQPSVWLSFDYGGAVRTGTAGVVPPGMRDAMYEAQLPLRWFDPEDDEPQMTRAQEVVSTFYNISSHSYVNEFTTWEGKYNVVNDWKTRFFSDYGGLLKLKKKYDPCNLFTVKYGVGSDLPVATCM